ncbi:hypothetical protein [Novosphingobium sp. CECT 9465]|uniref:hypothetical protein n=1 Tax=Novosphingobium sp. CECT 9465 TaxID=2829794 RepID=UPI001E624164|nr:hypothetical protein [Novosphingobium sp. CECT 9465]CAH0498423.1 hypothetical protein NVSP9465_03510 [Novosphingobium sp. CECT 9465]
MYAKTSDAISRTATVLGYSKKKQAQDIVAMSSVLGNERRSNPTIMDRHRAACRRYGLAS